MNIARGIDLLKKYGEIRKISTVWESESVGGPGPNYLNVCLLFVSTYTKAQLKEQVIDIIETQLGRIRTEDKYIPRTIDIDIILFDDKHTNAKDWESAFMIVPLAEIYPEYQNPFTGEIIGATAERLRKLTWIQPRPEVIRGNDPVS